MSAHLDNDPSSSFLSSENLVITGGEFFQTVNDNRQYYGQSGRTTKALEVLKDAAAPAAFHDSAARFDPPRCHPCTRSNVLQKIMNWALGKDKEALDSFIMWLTGAAGAGKSAIAQSIIEQILVGADNILVLASFFFNKSDPTRDRADSLIATLAYQACRVIPAIQAQIASAIDDDPLIFTKTLDHQFHTLILQPLQALCISGHFNQSLSRYLIVIDGLDECTNHASQRAIINMISCSIHGFRLPIVFLIASRQEHDIKEVFMSKSMHGIHICLNLDNEDRFDTGNDIRSFLEYEFRKIQHEHPFREMIPDKWPEYDVISEIAAKSTGQFIYAVTVIKFVKSSRHRPDHRLEIVRQLRPANGHNPFKELDALYIYILSSIDTENIGKVLESFSFFFLFANVYIGSTNEIEKFLSLDEGELHRIFCDLGALVEIERISWGNTVNLKIFHASLQDFLLDCTRSGDLYINLESARTTLVGSCLHYMSMIPTGRVDINIKSLIYLFEAHADRCSITSDLIDQVVGFPAHQACSSSYFIDIHTEKSLCSEFLLSFHKLIKRIIDENSKLNFIHEQYLHALDTIFLSKIGNYYSRGSLSLLIALLFHAGNHYLVPLFRTTSDRFLLCPEDILEEYPNDILAHDELSLFETFILPPNVYMKRFKDFLKDQSRSQQYTLSGQTYAHAALYCMQFLEDEKWNDRLLQSLHLQRNDLSDDEDEELPNGDAPIVDGAKYNRGQDEDCDLCDSLYLKDERWSWKSGGFKDENHTDYDAQLYPLVLGYLIYFLPLSDRYEPLIQHCQRHTLSSGSPAAYFPNRSKRASHRIKEYLNRMDADGSTCGFLRKWKNIGLQKLSGFWQNQHR